MRCATFLAVFLSLSAQAPADPPFVAGLTREGTEPLAGAVLIGELGCAACHATPQAAFAPKPAPDLSTVGARVTGPHLESFIASPSSVKPGTTMPDVLESLPENRRLEAARALAHFLATLGKPTPWTAPEATAVERGARLYHTVGCVACHSPEQGLPQSVPLGPLSEKYTVASLAAFLERPLDIRPGGRMPDCHLDRTEAVDIASYLLRDRKSPPPPFEPDPALVDRGRALFADLRCDACHSTGGRPRDPAQTPLGQLRADAGCLSSKPGPWPRYPFSDGQRTAITAALREQWSDLSPATLANLSMVKLNCIACHKRDDLGGIPTARNEYFTGTEESLGEQGRIPPPLTGVGAKLQGRWMREVVAHGASVRTTMNTRMSKFGPTNADSLTVWLKQIDSLPPAAIDRVPETDKPHQVGRDLAGAKGLNCIACHAFRGRTAAIRGPELTTMAERLEENWFHHYLTQPQRFSPLTVMPSFWPDGRTALPDVLGGDPGRQRDALWQYLAQGPEAGEPAGIVLEPLIVAVKDEAVIIRRAFPGIGKRGIAVGYPGGLNLAFDASQMRLASLWSGGFIEASGLWRGQGSGQAHILGKDTVTFPNGPAFAILATPDTPWPEAIPTPKPSIWSFKGYSLDEKQRPTFRYSTADFIVEDFFHERRDAAGQLFFERTLKPSATPPGLHFRLAAGSNIERQSETEYALGDKLRIRVSSPAFLRTVGTQKELLLPAQPEMRVEYRFGKPR